MVETGKRAEDRAFTDCPEAEKARNGPGMLPPRSRETATRQALQRVMVNGGIEVAGDSDDGLAVSPAFLAASYKPSSSGRQQDAERRDGLIALFSRWGPSH